MPAKSIKQQRFFGMVRAAQKGEMENPSPEVAKAASSMSKPDVKKFAKTKHKGLPMKKESVFAGNYEGPLYAPHPDLVEDSRRTSNKQQTKRVKANIKAFGSNYTPPNNYDPDANRGQGEVVTRKQMEKKRRKALRQEDTVTERADFWDPDPDKDRKLGGPGANQRAREDRAAGAKKSSSGQKSDPKKLRKGESYMDYAKRQRAGKSASAPKPKPKERKRDKIGRKLGNLVDRIGGIKKEEVSIDEGKKKGLWDRIHAKRKRGERPARPGEKDYPKTLNVEGTDTPVAAIKTNELKTFKQFCEGAAWTKKSGQNSEGGLNEKGRKSYERENPGSDLKAPSKKVGNPRRASFCARMKGMRKRQKPSNNTGDDRLSKSLRAWNC